MILAILTLWSIIISVELLFLFLLFALTDSLSGVDQLPTLFGWDGSTRGLRRNVVVGWMDEVLYLDSMGNSNVFEYYEWAVLDRLHNSSLSGVVFMNYFSRQR